MPYYLYLVCRMASLISWLVLFTLKKKSVTGVFVPFWLAMFAGHPHALIPRPSKSGIPCKSSLFVTKYVGDYASLQLFFSCSISCADISPSNDTCAVVQHHYSRDCCSLGLPFPVVGFITDDSIMPPQGYGTRCRWPLPMTAGVTPLALVWDGSAQQVERWWLNVPFSHTGALRYFYILSILVFSRSL